MVIRKTEDKKRYVISCVPKIKVANSLCHLFKNDISKNVRRKEKNCF